MITKETIEEIIDKIRNGKDQCEETGLSGAARCSDCENRDIVIAYLIDLKNEKI